MRGNSIIKIYSIKHNFKLPLESFSNSSGKFVFENVDWKIIGKLIAAVALYALVLGELIPPDMRNVGQYSVPTPLIPEPDRPSPQFANQAR